MRILRSFIAMVRRRLTLARYNDFTIAEYFRSQGARIGDDCRIMIRTFGSEPFLVEIGNHCTIAPEAALVTHDGGAWIFTNEIPSLQSFGRIVIEDNCFIGLRAIIMPGVRIGRNSVVGAGAVVTKDVPPNSVVVGCPAKVLFSTAEYREKLERLWTTQRPTGYLEELQPNTHYPAIEIHRRKQASLPLLRRHLQRTLS